MSSGNLDADSVWNAWRKSRYAEEPSVVERLAALEDPEIAAKVARADLILTQMKEAKLNARNARMGFFGGRRKGGTK